VGSSLCWNTGKGEIFLQAFGEALKEERERKKLSTTALASMVGVSRSAIRHYERGLREPGLYTFYSLCKALSVKPQTLLKEGF